MNKAVEPLTDEALRDLAQFLELPNRREGFDLKHSAARAKLQNWGFVDGGKTPRRLLATIEADREKLAKEQEATAKWRKMAEQATDHWESQEARAEAAEARISVLEKERDARPGISLAEYAQVLNGVTDDMLVDCENCGAWMHRDEEACASTGDFVGCWRAATCDESQPCVRHRSPAAIGLRLTDKGYEVEVPTPPVKGDG